MSGEHVASLDTRLYRVGLRLCPAEFRRDHGDEMAGDFDEARSEVAVGDNRAMWMLRLLVSLDLARTVVVQWLRTGLPAIGCAALVVSLVSTVGLASAVRTLTLRIPAYSVESEGVVLVLLAIIAIMVIVATIVFNLCLVRPRRAGRR
jgi:hypothetical protein